jgi:hypothetical protein
MRISTNQVSSVVLRPKKLEIRKIVKTVKKPTKKKILCHEIEPNLSKDRALHEGDNPSYYRSYTVYFKFLQCTYSKHLRFVPSEHEQMRLIYDALRSI